jgi:hypothetical protein
MNSRHNNYYAKKIVELCTKPTLMSKRDNLIKVFTGQEAYLKNAKPMINEFIKKP